MVEELQLAQEGIAASPISVQFCARINGTGYHFS